MPEDFPPLGAGFCAVIVASEAPVRSAAGIVVVSCVALTKVVFSDEAFHDTTVEGTNPLPLIVMGRSGEPAVALVGVMPVMAGNGLFTVKLTADDVPPPGVGFSTVSFAVVPFARSVVGIVACRLEEETNVVASAVPFH
jgi:hypothetical protein